MMTGLHTGRSGSRPCVLGCGTINVKGLLPSVTFHPSPSQRSPGLWQTRGAGWHSGVCQSVSGNKGLMFYLFRPQNHLMKWVSVNPIPVLQMRKQSLREISLFKDIRSRLCSFPSPPSSYLLLSPQRPLTHGHPPCPHSPLRTADWFRKCQVSAVRTLVCRFRGVGAGFQGASFERLSHVHTAFASEPCCSHTRPPRPWPSQAGTVSRLGIGAGTMCPHWN